MLKWLEENGYDKNSAEGQGRYMVHEAFSGKYAGSANALRNANKDNIKDVTSVLTTEFEAPAETTQNIINRTSIANQEINNGISAARSYDLGPEASDDTIKSAIVKRKQGQQEQQLASIVESKKQAGPTATPDNRSTGVYTAGDSIGQGVGQSNRLQSVAQQGMSFTDPRMAQQLKNIPKGATVQLYAGTNDAAGGRLDPKEYEARMAELKQIAEERGLNVSIHGPHQSTNKKWGQNVGTVNQMLGDTARNSGFKYVDNSSVAADAPDGVHMSNKAYQELYNRSLPAAPAEPEAIPAMAEGGDLNVNEGEIKALPIGAMKNDNSVVVDKDSKPLFTMNTKEESANYNPDTGKVSVDPNAKKENDGGQELSLDQQSTFKQSQVPIPESSGMSSFDTTLTLTDNMFKDPSFHRAMSRARFDISGDSASGNHFSSSATVS
jgi:lysophospholipase L1-like esterase